MDATTHVDVIADRLCATALFILDKLIPDASKQFKSDRRIQYADNLLQAANVDLTGIEDYLKMIEEEVTE